MTTVFTPSLGFAKQATGTNDQVWGDVLNEGFIGLVDDAIAGRVDVDVTAGNVSLTSIQGATDQARMMFIMISAGTPGTTRDIVVPTLNKVYLVHNNVGDGSDLRIRTATGTGVTVEDGSRSAIFVDQNFGDCREIGLATGGGGSSVSPMPTATNTPSVFRDNDGISGLRFPNVFTSEQGNIGYIGIPNVADPASNVTINSTAWILEPQVGTYPTFPILEDMSFHFQTIENSVGIDTIAVYKNDGSMIEFFKADGTLWTFGSSRAIDVVSQKPIMFGLTGT